MSNYVPHKSAGVISYAYPNLSVISVASFTKEVKPRLAKRPLKINGRLANRSLTSLVNEATVSKRGPSM